MILPLRIFQHILAVIVTEACQCLRFTQLLLLCKGKNLTGSVILPCRVFDFSVTEACRGKVVMSINDRYGVTKLNGFRLSRQVPGGATVVRAGPPWELSEAVRQ